MKKLIVAAVALSIFAMAGKAMALGTNTLTVSASVLGTCGFVSPTSTLAFGALDSGNPVTVNASTTVQYLCSKGVTATVTGPASGTMLDGVSGDTIDYTLVLTSDPNASGGAAQNLVVDGTVLGPAYAGKTAGSYSGTVTLTVNP